MGCPAGIGPEIILKYFKNRTKTDSSSPVVIGDIGVLQHTAHQLGIDISCIAWKPNDPFPKASIPVFSVSTLELRNLQWGKPTRQTGLAMAAYIESAVTLCNQGQFDGIVTCHLKVGIATKWLRLSRTYRNAG